jgi:hypothetical protein
MEQLQLIRQKPQTRIGDLIHHILYIEKCRELYDISEHEDYELFEAEVNQLPFEFPANFISLSSAELVENMQKYDKAQTKLYDKFVEIYGEENFRDEDIFWYEYDLMVIFERYYQQELDIEETHESIIGPERVLEASKTLAELVLKSLVQTRQTVPADLINIIGTYGEMAWINQIEILANGESEEFDSLICHLSFSLSQSNSIQISKSLSILL